MNMTPQISTKFSLAGKAALGAFRKELIIASGREVSVKAYKQQVAFNAVLTEDEGEIQKANARAEMEWKLSSVSEIAYVKQRPADERDSRCCGCYTGGSLDYIWIKAQFEAKDGRSVEQRNYM